MLSRLPWQSLFAVIAGASLVLSFAPFGYWPLSMLSLMAFYRLIYQQPVRVQIYLHYAFALGLFGFGITWIYVSIHTYGGADKSLAMAMTGLFVLFWSLTFVPQGWLLGHIQKSQILPQLPWFAMTFVANGTAATPTCMSFLLSHRSLHL